MLQHVNRIRRERGNDYVIDLECVESSARPYPPKTQARRSSTTEGSQRSGGSPRGKQHD